MRPLDYLRILQRRWWILVVGALIGSMLAFLTQPSEQAVARKTAPKVQFRSQALLVVKSGSASDVGLDRLALDTVYGPVPRAAMEKLNADPYSGQINDNEKSSSEESDSNSNSATRRRSNATDPAFPKFRAGKGEITLYSPDFGLMSVAPVPDPATAALAIVATGDREASVRAANTFGDELIAHLGAVNVTRWEQNKAALASDRQVAVERAVAIDGQIVAAANSPALPGLMSRRADLAKRIETIDEDLARLEKSGPAPSPLEIYEPAAKDRVTAIVGPAGTAVTSGQRLILGAAIGLFLGLALIVAIELLDARVRDVAGTEGAARMPVVAEIPVVKMNRADRFSVATASDPASLTAEAYRSLRTSLLAMWQRHPKNVAEAAPNGNGHANGTGHANGHPAARTRPLRTLLVTSPGPAEGKSISVVNLAAAFAETGVTVIIIDADFRRPTQTRYLDRPRNPNLGDLDLHCSVEDLEAILQETEVPGVRLAAAAPTKSDPGHAIAVAKSAVAAAMQLADIVIVDSPPLLLANDASDLALGVDATVLLARAGWTRRGGIVASADLLRRLEASVIGVVIVGAEHGARAGYYGYYGYYGYGYGYAHPGETSIMNRLLPWKGARKTPPASTPRSRSGPHGGVPRPPASVPRDVDDPWV